MKELTVNESQTIALEILKFISDICEKINLKYCLTWGTLIGAIRHKGFIPWDDDIDIFMPREDYIKFINYMRARKDKKYVLYSIDDKDNYYLSLVRIVDSETLVLGERKEVEKQCDCGIFVDIYPLDYVGKSRKKIKSFFKQQMIYEWLKGLAIQNKYVKSKSSKVNTYLKIPFFLYAKLLGYKYFYHRMENNAWCKNNLLSQFCCSCYGTGGCPSDLLIYPSLWFEELIECDFEQYKFKIPKYYNEILTQMYGDYMKLPPEEERIGHHNYKAYIL